MKSNNLDLKVILAIVLMAVVICSSCFFSIFMIKGNIAHADSSNGIVEDNIISDSNFMTGVTIGTDVGTWRLVSSASLLDYDGYYRFSGTGSSQLQYYFDTDTSSSLNGNTYTLSVCSNYGVQSAVQTNVSSTTNYSGSSIVFTNGYSVRLRGTGNGSIFVQFLQNGVTNSYLDLFWIKLELGSSFTGYVPKDYVNYGYDQGYSDGYDQVKNIIEYNKIGYSYIGDTAYYNSFASDNDLVSTSFTLNGVSYDYSNAALTEASFNSWVYNSTTGNPAVKLSSPYLFGNIMYNLPFYNGEYNRFMFVIEDTSTGDLRTIRFNDSQYVKLMYVEGLYDVEEIEASTGAQYNQWYYISLRFYSSEVCNIYLMPEVTENGYRSEYNLWFANELGFLYSTRGNSDFGSYTTGYDNGYETGYNEGNSVGLFNGKIIGRNEAWAEADAYYQAMGSDIGYSFSDLLYAIVDSPVKVLGDFLNFDFLGFNLKAFFFSIITIAIIILIVKRFI